MQQDTSAAPTVLVTGGAGYIGSHMVLALLRLGWRVVVLDNLSTGSRAAVPAGAEFVEGDVGDKELLERLMEKYRFKAVLHFAALVSVPESVREPEKYLRNNTDESRVLIEAVAQSRVMHFIFSSTAAVYGEPTMVPVPEDAEPKPINPYGESKMLAEMILRTTGAQYNFSHVILRYFNVAGTDPKGEAGYSLQSEPSHLIRVALKTAFENEGLPEGKWRPLPVFGTDYPTDDGTCVRDYIHVADLVDAHLRALHYLQAGGPSRVFNCGYGHGHSVLQVAQAVKRVTGLNLPLKYKPRRNGDPAALIADASRIRETLGWEPQYDDIDTIIRHQFEWEKSQRHG